MLPNTFKSALVPFFAGIPVRTGYLGEMRHWLLNDARKLDEKRLPQMAQRYAALGAARAGEPLPAAAARARACGWTKPRGARCSRGSGSTAAGRWRRSAPGAEYGPAKRWPARYFAELAQGLAARGCAVWLVGSQNDRQIGAEIERISGGVCRNLCGETTLAEAIDLLASARARRQQRFRPHARRGGARQAARRALRLEQPGLHAAALAERARAQARSARAARASSASARSATSTA